MKLDKPQVTIQCKQACGIIAGDGCQGLACHMEPHDAGWKAYRRLAAICLPHCQHIAVRLIEGGLSRQHRRHIQIGLFQQCGHA